MFTTIKLFIQYDNISNTLHYIHVFSKFHYELSYESALIDAEIALEFMPGSFRGLLAMGEALYHKASFEYSLLYYYR